MKDRALYYYMNGYNCSQCILKAVTEHYKIPASEQVFDMLQGINNGLGVGCMCSLLAAGIMAFGLLFDSAVVKRLRIKLLHEFNLRYKDMNCPSIKGRGENRRDCRAAVGDVAEIIGRIIDEELVR